MKWHKLSVEDAMKETGSGPKGLSRSEAEKKLQQFGPNELQEAKRKSIAGILISQFKDLMILILLGAAIISGIVGDLTDTIIILIIVILNAIIGFFQEYRAEKAMQALKQMAIAKTNVMRDGKISTLPANELVPGDIISLEAGNVIPADIRIIESINLKIEEAALTGESEATDKISDAIAEDE